MKNVAILLLLQVAFCINGYTQSVQTGEELQFTFLENSMSAEGQAVKLSISEVSKGNALKIRLAKTNSIHYVITIRDSGGKMVLWDPKENSKIQDGTIDISGLLPGEYNLSVFSDASGASAVFATSFK